MNERLKIRQTSIDDLNEYRIVRIAEYAELYNEEILEIWGTESKAKKRKEELENFLNIN